MGTRLFIGNLSYNVNEQELKEAFTSEGIDVRSVRVSLDRETGRPRGFAFVETETDAGAKASIEKLSGRILQGRQPMHTPHRSTPAQDGSHAACRPDARRDSPDPLRLTQPSLSASGISNGGRGAFTT